MKITAKLFEKCFYSIGAGLDIQPLLRFTHITDTFIYANLFLEKEKVISWYEDKFRIYEFEIIDMKEPSLVTLKDVNSIFNFLNNS